MFSLIECVLYVFLWQKNTLRISVTLTVKKKKKHPRNNYYQLLDYL